MCAGKCLRFIAYLQGMLADKSIDALLASNLRMVELVNRFKVR